MKPAKVHILATCRKKELLPYTEFVFRTIRVGFPTAEIVVHLNNLKDLALQSVVDMAKGSGCVAVEVNTIHHEWIQSLVESEPEPFWVCDTDVVFWESVENWTFHEAIAGRRIPEWKDEFSSAITRSRIHTSLMWINPKLVLEKVSKYLESVPNTPFTPVANLFNPLIVSFGGERVFYDTCSLLFHAIGGQSFSNAQLDAFDHFNFGTISDLVIPRIGGGEEMRLLRDEAIKNPARMRGAWREQELFYASRPAIKDGSRAVVRIPKEEAADALKLNMELCCGDSEAMTFCDCWYNYCHGIDDLIDTMEDGRPTLSKDEIISLFFKAAILYNSSFYKRHRDIMFPIILSITNTYADSVAWEKSPKAHLRLMGDLMRTCGNEMYKTVALICGGESHMKHMGRKIMERDWLGQHDENGRPT